MKNNRTKYRLGRTRYHMKPNSVKFENAVSKIIKALQEEENKKYGKDSATITYAWATEYIYEKYLKGRPIK